MLSIETHRTGFWALGDTVSKKKQRYKKEAEPIDAGAIFLFRDAMRDLNCTEDSRSPTYCIYHLSNMIKLREWAQDDRL